jgi:GNAT superfamily N-acetyltransferase
MTKRASEPPPQIELVPASSKQESILANLLELYAHDFSEFHDLELGIDGRFGYRSLSLYWSDPDRHPFLIAIDGKLAGLTLVKRGSEFSGNQTVWDMAEFFVIRAYRRRGIGTQIAHQVWRRFPGGGGKSASCSRMYLHTIFGRGPSQHLHTRRSLLWLSKKMASAGNSSHLNPRCSLAKDKELRSPCLAAGCLARRRQSPPVQQVRTARSRRSSSTWSITQSSWPSYTSLARDLCY